MPLNSTENAHLKLQMSRIDRNLAEIYNEEVQLMGRIANLQEERQVNLAQKKRIMNVLQSSIYTLPVEILAQILVLTVAHASPVLSQRRVNILQLVCHRWREAAISEPSLWSYINMRESPPFEKSRVYLHRSGTCPLWVELDFKHYGPFDAHARTFIKEHLAPHLRRCQTFLLSANEIEPFILCLPRLVAYPAPYLERLEVLCFCSDQLERLKWDKQWNSITSAVASAFRNEAPRLSNMTISGLYAPWSSFSAYALTTLAYDFHTTDIKRSLFTFIDILGCSRNLRSLTIMQSGSTVRVPPELAVEALSRLPPPSASVSKSSGASLPVLEDLSLSFVESQLGRDILKMISAPAVSTLSLEYLKGDSADLLECMIERPLMLPHLTHLRLIGLGAIREGVLGMFLQQACRHVTSLHVNAVNAPTLKQVSYVLRWMALERRVYVMPKLQEISSDGLTPRVLREMIQCRPPKLRPTRVVMRRKDWRVRDDECMTWLKDKVDVRFVDGSSDDEFD